jgi:hypothetical protein
VAGAGLSFAMSFQEDDRIRQAAEAYALEAVALAREKLGTELDFSDESIRLLDKALLALQARLADARPSEQQFQRLAKMFGSYLGEVLRRNHGAQWGMVTLEGESSPGMRVDRGGTACWPWGRVQTRLVNGTEDSVWLYYAALTQGGAGGG